MKLLIDTVNKDFYIAIVEENKTIDYIHIENLIKKSDALPVEYKKLIDRNNLMTSDLKGIYINKGPGSFMGIRAGFVFGKILAMMLNIPFHTCDNLLFISQGIDGEYFVDAKGNKSYKGSITNKTSSIELVDFVQDSMVNYENLINNPKNILELFTVEEDVINAQPLYFKEPQIGGAK